MSKNREDIVLTAKLAQSTAKENKKTNDSFVVTQLKSVAREGMFNNFSQALETLVFKQRFWTAIKTGTLSGEWTFTVLDTRTNQEIVCLNKCTIKNITITVKKEGLMEVSITIEHALTGLQSALMSAVSAIVSVTLEKDRENVQLSDDIK